MEGCSRLVFEGAHSPKDLISFHLYSQRRRPNHSSLQCYDPILRDIPNTSKSGDTASAFSEYYLHACHQFNLAKCLGGASFGSLKIQIKYGNAYITHLPRLFLEEIGSSTIETVHLALSKGYKFVNASKEGMEGDEWEGRDVASLEIGRTPAILEEPKSLEIALPTSTEIPQPKTSDAPRRPRKRTTLSPMTSAFEASVTLTSTIVDELVGFGFQSLGKSSGYIVGTFLYDCNADRNCNLQLLYDDQLEFLRASHRPLRWLLDDVKACEGDGVDIRIALSSTRRLKFEDDQQSSDIALGETELERLLHATESGNPDEGSRAVIKQGILEPHKDTIRIREAFRGKDDKIFVRHSVTERFQPKSPGLLLPLLSTDPLIRAILSSPGHPPPPSDLLSLFTASIMHVTEYSDPDPQSGQFQTIIEKCEFEWQLPLEWNQLLSDTCRDSIIRALWTVAQIGRIIVRRSSRQ